MFAVDTIACVEPDDDDYLIAARARIDARRELILKTKNRFDAQTKTQFSPGIYELTEDGEPIGSREHGFPDPSALVQGDGRGYSTPQASR